MAAHTPEGIHGLLESAFNTGDLHAFVEAFEPDATAVAPQDGRVLHGREEIRRATEPLFALRPRIDIEVLGKVEGDGLALTFARWQLRHMDPDGDPVELTGRGTIVSRRQPDGSWQVVLENPVSPG